MTRAVLSRGRANKMHVSYELKEGQSRLFHELPSGLTMEVIVQKGVVDKGPDPGVRKETPLVFVHGSYHAAWCWAEHWLPLFSASGYDCYAISLLAQVGFLSPLSSAVSDFVLKHKYLNFVTLSLLLQISSLYSLS